MPLPTVISNQWFSWYITLSNQPNHQRAEYQPRDRTEILVIVIAYKAYGGQISLGYLNINPGNCINANFGIVGHAVAFPLLWQMVTER